MLQHLRHFLQKEKLRSKEQCRDEGEMGWGHRTERMMMTRKKMMIVMQPSEENNPRGFPQYLGQHSLLKQQRVKLKKWQTKPRKNW